MLNFAMAREIGGRFLLRIEDIDIGRCRREYEEAILADLAWLGLEWKEPVRRQSDHFEDYAEALDRLIEEGLVYPAFMSRGDIRAHIAGTDDAGASWPRDPDGAALYPGLDRDLSRAERRQRIVAGDPYSWRIDMAAAVGAGRVEAFHGVRKGRGRKERQARWQPSPKRGAMSSWRGANVPTSYSPRGWWWMTLSRP